MGAYLDLDSQASDLALAQLTLNMGLRSFGTIALATAVDLTSETDIEIRKWNSSSEVSPARYSKFAVAPTHNMKFQDAAGNWFAINEPCINVLSAGAIRDGATDNYAAFLLAVNAAKNGAFEVPPGTYYFATAVNGDQSQRMIKRNGASFTGPGLGVFTVNWEWQRGNLDHSYIKGAPQYGSVVGRYDDIHTTGSAGYGRRLDYWQEGVLTSGFSIADGRLGIFDNIDGGTGLTDWVVASSPTDTVATWSTICAEWNIVNLGDDLGYSRKRSTQIRWTGGLQIVPESKNLAHGGPAVGRNALFAFAVCRSESINVIDNDYTKVYNGFMVEENSIAPNGVGYLASGAPSATRQPKKAHSIDAYWEEGINLASAVFSTNRAITLDYAHNITFGSTGLIAALQANSGGYLSTYINGEEQLRVRRPGGVTANHLTIEGMVAGSGFVSMIAEGSDTNISLKLSAKGTGGIWLYGQGSTAIAKFSAVASAVNTFNIFSHVSGSAPTIAASSSTDTDVDISIAPQNAGKLKYGTFTSNADAAINGYMQIKDSSGNIRKLATIA